MRRNICLIFCFIFMLLFFSGSPASSAQGQPLTIVSAWEASTIDPVVSGFVFTRMGCLETLVTSDKKGGIEPRLATTWKVSEDGLIWVFELRKGVIFHDGTPLTGEVAAASLNRTLAKGSLFKGTPIQSFSGEGMNVIVTTERPFSALPAYLVHYASAICAPSSFDKEGKVVKVVGTGFYRLTSFQEGKVIDFESFNDYWGDNASISHARYFAVPNPETRVLLAESGEGDIVVDIPADAALRLRENKNLTVISDPLPRVRLLTVNAKLPFFSSSRLRHALSYLIDREGIAKALLKNNKSGATQLFPTVSAWHNPKLTPLNYDPEKGRKILKEEGWLPEGKQKILTKNGQPFVFEILTYSSRPDLPVIAEVIQQALRNEGIIVKIRVEKSGMVPEGNKNGTLESAFIARNFGFVADPIGTLTSDFGPEKGRGGWGAINWNSTTFDEAVKTYIETFETERQVSLRKTMTSILQEELPAIPIAWYDNHVTVNHRIQGVSLDPSEVRPYPEGVEWAK
ncbi:MAG: ABC transporter substrate-binding protein [Aminobacterium sp.]|jgi:peptide/nickel transport system substrate-binding protein|nr:MULTISPECIES: ABC transporter substrate-binding protein [unclassified Aminobacterium]MDD2207295.1 ABC transporter substrate-binding protein [Aminobacterium sp.]MDD3426636.1 ABC transporter substrate-binding protein [Aminobacterium sp.]MDD4551681.1 ABC transporter substrate-binding protein [Aminobacterium sp.]MEA4877707.1 ABC transporter substrate-binding protein [Aminobacterium sp.]WMI70827.1 ABC transporter substrate-binding protein [Aminobacterium sp. MB27-C1]